MKKFFTVLAAVAVMTMFAACGGSGKKDDTGKKGDSASKENVDKQKKDDNLNAGQNNNSVSVVSDAMRSDAQAYADLFCQAYRENRLDDATLESQANAIGQKYMTDQATMMAFGTAIGEALQASCPDAFAAMQAEF